MRLFVILTLLAAPVRAWAAGAEFLRVPLGARAVGMGGAYTGLADGALGLAYNPAGLAFLRRKEVELSHSEFGTGLRQEWAGYAHPTPWGTFAASANILFVPSFEAYDELDRPAAAISAQDAAYQLSYAAAFSRRLALGVSGKMITSRLDTYSARTYAADVGAMWRPARGLSLGVAALHLGRGLRYISEVEELPRELRAGAAWTPVDPRRSLFAVILTGDAVKAFDRLSLRAGGEIWYDTQVAFRAGIVNDADSGPGYSLGVGLRFYRDELRAVGLGFDYAFTDSGVLGQLHRAGLSLRFGHPLTDGAWSEVFRRRQRYFEDAPTPRPRRAPQAPEPARPSASEWPQDVIAP